MASVNLAQLRTLARLLANARPAGANAFVVDADLNTLLNLRLASLYDLLVQAHGHEYYAADTAVAIVANTAAYSLAGLNPPFYQVLDVRLEWDAQNFEPVLDTSQHERSAFQNYATWSRWSQKAWRLRGLQGASASTLEFFPVPTVAVTARVRYVPAFVVIPDDVTTFDSVNGWEKLVALGAAIDMKIAAEKSLGELGNQYAQEYDRVQTIADKRAAAQPPRIIDVRPDRNIGEWLGDRRWI